LSLEFSPFDANQDLEKQRSLFLDAFPENAGSIVAEERFYRWKFHSYPDAARTAYEYQARDGEDILGYYAAIPYRYHLEGQEVCVAMVCDVMTHSLARGKGVFTKLGRYATNQMAEAGLAISLGYPIRPEVLPGHLKVGWRVIQELPIYIRPLRGAPFAKSLNLPWLAMPASAGVAIYSLVFAGLAAVRAPLRGAKICKGTITDLTAHVGFGELQRRWSEPLALSLKKDPPFMLWRFAAPGAVYTSVWVESGDMLLGYAITRVTQLKGIPTMAILDLAIDPASPPSTVEAILQTVERDARASGLAALTAMMSRYWAKKMRLINCGYLPSPHVFKLIGKDLNGTIPPLPEHTINTMWIDSDDL